MQQLISTGIEALDKKIKGYPADGITTFYGSAGSGKTNLVLTAGIAMTKRNKKVIIINTEGEIIIDRLKQLIGESDLSSFIFINQKTFKEQDQNIIELCKSTLERVGMIIFDSSNKLLRAEFNQENKKKFKEQLAMMKRKARFKKIPLLMTAQVYHSYAIEKEVIYAGGMINEFSDCIIELSSLNKVRKLTLKKHNNIIGEQKFLFKIKKEGMTPFILQ